MSTLCIAAGRKDKVRPGDILGALTGEAGIPGAQVGKIAIFDFQAFVAVERGIRPIFLSATFSSSNSISRFLQCCLTRSSARSRKPWLCHSQAAPVASSISTNIFPRVSITCAPTDCAQLNCVFNLSYRPRFVAYCVA